MLGALAAVLIVSFILVRRGVYIVAMTLLYTFIAMVQAFGVFF